MLLRGDVVGAVPADALEERGVRVAMEPREGLVGKELLEFSFARLRAFRVVELEGRVLEERPRAKRRRLHGDLRQIFARDDPGQRVALRTGRVDGVEAETMRTPRRTCEISSAPGPCTTFSFGSSRPPGRMMVYARSEPA